MIHNRFPLQIKKKRAQKTRLSFQCVPLVIQGRVCDTECSMKLYDHGAKLNSNPKITHSAPLLAGPSLHQGWAECYCMTPKHKVPENCTHTFREPTLSTLVPVEGNQATSILYWGWVFGGNLAVNPTSYAQSKEAGGRNIQRKRPPSPSLRVMNLLRIEETLKQTSSAEGLSFKVFVDELPAKWMCLKLICCPGRRFGKKFSYEVRLITTHASERWHLVGYYIHVYYWIKVGMKGNRKHMVQGVNHCMGLPQLFAFLQQFQMDIGFPYRHYHFLLVDDHCN